MTGAREQLLERRVDLGRDPVFSHAEVRGRGGEVVILLAEWEPQTIA